MSTRPIVHLVDAGAFSSALDAIVARHGAAAFESGGRAELLECIKPALKAGFAAAEANLNNDGNGLRCAEDISAMMDVMIHALCAAVHRTVFRGRAPGPADAALLAVGGYGRGTLAPFSDIDLLFLLPQTADAGTTRFIETILYVLWDCGLKVGHATRTVGECIKAAKGDTTICTTLIEGRRLWGDIALAAELEQTFNRQVTTGSSRAYVEAKLAERDERHLRSGDTRYLVEPNIKEGKGGLRDIQTLFWITKYHYRIRDERQLVDMKVLTPAELQELRKADAFLWSVRCQLHFVAGKAEERLSFDYQREIAARLGYHDHPGLTGVERFMKHYFLIAKDVGDLTRVLCAALEEANAKAAPGWGSMLTPWRRGGRKPIKGTDFVIDHGKINVADDGVFIRDPVNFIRMFHLAQRNDGTYHPGALRLATQSLRLIGHALRVNPEANRLFVEILTSRRNPELHLRRMNESGVLGRFVPEWGQIVAMMQFSMYHHYTVDEHLLRAINALSLLWRGEIKEEHPLATSLLPELDQHRRILFVALFLHDIAKGRPEDHSIEGAKIARRLCPRFGLTPAESDAVVWLIEQHLTMSTIAQTRDLADRKTIEDFAAIVQSMDRMKLLLVLTVCDIRAVGPATFTGWKGQLLRTLYAETELMLTGGFSEGTRAARGEAQRKVLEAALPAAWPQGERARYAGLFYHNYLLATATATQLRHATFLRESDAAGKRLATMFEAKAFEGVTEITVLAPDHPRLLSIIAGACSGTGADIVSAQIFTTTDGRALDTIRIAREFPEAADEVRRAGRIGALIEDVLSGRASLPDTIHRQRKKRMAKVFSITPRVEVRNALSHRYSVIEIECLDRIGLLAEITRAISDLSLDIESAQITTYGEKVIDTFYVTDLMGFKIDDPQRQGRIIKRLIQVIEEGMPGVGKRWSREDSAEAAGITP